MMRVLLLVVLLLLAGAAPAAAHDVSEHGAPGVASNLRSTPVSAPLPGGVTVDVLHNGQALLLRNGSGVPVTVVTSGGSARMEVPAGGRLQWHEDAAHPDPSVVGPDRPVRQWRVELLTGGQRYEAVGEVRWTPGPSPWPWFAAAAVLAAVVAAAARRRWLAAPLGAAVAASVTHNAAALAARAGESSLLGDYLPQAGCWALGAAAAYLLARDRGDGLWLGALASAGLVLLTATRAAPVLWSSTVLVSLPATLDRLLVIAASGLAAGYLLALPRIAQPVRAPRRP
ncbi:MAG: hypothetical protein GEV09_10915 [Pseudonocardiaceae bacterium]|nr:hypothetical protein [Pseudonocardiaceae bacterium]